RTDRGSGALLPARSGHGDARVFLLQSVARAVHFLWERRDGKSKQRCAQFRSRASMLVHHGSGALIYDHAVPFRYLQKELLDLRDVTRESVSNVLKKHCVVVLVTKEENDQLNNAKLGS